MIRRDSERNHAYANEIFNSLCIYDIQGILKEGDDYKCGVENYQVKNFNQTDFSVLDNETEIARYFFCKQLGIPYYVIITSEDEKRFKIFETSLSAGNVIFEEILDLSIPEFVNWWRSHQSFNQAKPMYNAASRIENSIIDQVLFTNQLAWGVNVDGFTFNDDEYEVNAIYEKRICTYKPPYTVDNYDPNRFFHGTQSRAGDYPSWKILNNLAIKLSSSLVLLTFDTSNNPKVGATIITDISQQKGLTYLNNVRPFNNLYNNIAGLQEWKNNNI